MDHGLRFSETPARKRGTAGHEGGAPEQGEAPGEALGEAPPVTHSAFRGIEYLDSTPSIYLSVVSRSMRRSTQNAHPKRPGTRRASGVGIGSSDLQMTPPGPTQDFQRS